MISEVNSSKITTTISTIKDFANEVEYEFEFLENDHEAEKSTRLNSETIPKQPNSSLK
jgi:hypothetical protein